MTNGELINNVENIIKFHEIQEGKTYKMFLKRKSLSNTEPVEITIPNINNKHIQSTLISLYILETINSLLAKTNTDISEYDFITII